MMQAYGNALVAERLIPRRHAELAAYVRNEYGRGTGPEFLFAQIANGGAQRPRRRRAEASVGVFQTLAKAVKALVSGNGAGRGTKVSDPTR